MAIQFASYDDINMQTGKFYLVEVNKDNASNLRDVSTIVAPLNKATQDITEIKIKNDFQDIKINNLETYFEDYKEIILDNQARVNNLEDAEISKVINLIDKWSIRVNFENALNVEIQHNRKHVTSVKVIRIEHNNSLEILETNITAGTNITEKFTKDALGNVISKKVILNFGDTPLTGYAIIL